MPRKEGPQVAGKGRGDRAGPYRDRVERGEATGVKRAQSGVALVKGEKAGIGRGG